MVPVQRQLLPVGCLLASARGWQVEADDATGAGGPCPHPGCTVARARPDPADLPVPPADLGGGASSGPGHHPAPPDQGRVPLDRHPGRAGALRRCAVRGVHARHHRRRRSELHPCPGRGCHRRPVDRHRQRARALLGRDVHPLLDPRRAAPGRRDEPCRRAGRLRVDRHQRGWAVPVARRPLHHPDDQGRAGQRLPHRPAGGSGRQPVDRPPAQRRPVARRTYSSRSPRRSPGFVPARERREAADARGPGSLAEREDRAGSPGAGRHVESPRRPGRQPLARSGRPGAVPGPRRPDRVRWSAVDPAAGRRGATGRRRCADRGSRRQPLDWHRPGSRLPLQPAGGAAGTARGVPQRVGPHRGRGPRRARLGGRHRRAPRPHSNGLASGHVQGRSPGRPRHVPAGGARRHGLGGHRGRRAGVAGGPPRAASRAP